ncbi:MAG: M48 family metallopeptidase [Saprospiraceae bacterium]|nr:M48 family metallopeptidase [Saprospiraceae bacterium]
MNPQLINDLTVSDYEHPLETQAMARLKKTRGINKVISKFHELSFETSIRIQYLGSSLAVTPRTFPDLLYLRDKACEILHLSTIPELYIQDGETLSAVSIGVEEPGIILNTALVEKMTPEELLFVIGREVAHMKSDHILYQEIGMIFPEIMEAFSAITLGLSTVLSTGLRYALHYWKQTAEYTADRGGLIACQDVEVTKWMLAKWAGLPERSWSTFPIEEFMLQVANYDDATPNALEKVIGFFLGNNNWSVVRARELFAWIETDEYRSLFQRRI